MPYFAVAGDEAGITCWSDSRARCEWQSSSAALEEAGD